MTNGRRRPYTQIGIRRLRCFRAGCENQAEFQWQICADGNVYRPVCRPCDLELNAVVLGWLGVAGAAAKLRAYAEKGAAR